uniref:alpha-glucosidase n=1 Tax=Anopheles atroparvus TaxID=41427 RepID=A0AAG5DTC2_ANOAO
MALLATVILLGITLQLPCWAQENQRPLAYYRQEQTNGGGDFGEWWESSVFYQLIPRSFRDSDGDGNGDLAGLLERFDHLLELGVTGICLGPVFRSPKRDSGYDVSNFREIDPTYGTMDHFEEILRRAKMAGIRVVLDLVPNHTSEQHEWFQKSLRKEVDYRDYYVRREGSAAEDELDHPPNNWLSQYHTTAWTRNNRDSQYYLHQFGAMEPDLNYRSAKVQQEMEDVIRFWLDKGVDGIRFERVNHLLEDVQFRNEPLIDLEGPSQYDNLDHIHTRDLPENYAIAFDWRAVFNAYNQEGVDRTARKLMITSAHSDGTTQGLERTLKWFGIANRNGAHIAQNFGLLERLTNGSRAEDFQRVIGEWLGAMPTPGGANWMLGSHDHRRLASRFGRELAAGMAMLAFTLPGTVFLYYGDEIGMEDNEEISWKQSQDPLGCNTNASTFLRYSRDPARTPFQWDSSNEWAGFAPSHAPNKLPWLPVNSNYPTCNLANERTSNRSLFHLYRDLILLHQQSLTLRRGTYQSFALPNNVFAVLRSLAGDKAYATVLNVNPNTVTLDLNRMHRQATEASVVLASPEGDHEPGEIIEDISSVTLGRYESIIFELKSGTMAGLQAVKVLIAAIFGLGRLYNLCQSL